MVVGYLTAFQSNYGIRNPNGIAFVAFFFKDAVGLLEGRQIAVALFVGAGQLFVDLDNLSLLFDYRVGILVLDFFICLFGCKVGFVALFVFFIGGRSVLAQISLDSLSCLSNASSDCLPDS